MLDGEARTNNSVEGWNGNFNKFAQTKHPSLPKLIQKFREEQKNAELNVERILSGEKIRRVKQKTISCNQKLFDIVQSYDKENISKYLKSCTYCLSI